MLNTKNNVTDLRGLKSNVLAVVSEALEEAYDMGAGVSNKPLENDSCEDERECVKESGGCDINQAFVDGSVETWELVRILFNTDIITSELGCTPRQALFNYNVEEIRNIYLNKVNRAKECGDRCDDCECDGNCPEEDKEVNININEKQIHDIADSIAHVIVGAISNISK